MSESPYQQAAESIRSTVRWIIAALTGAGLLTIGGMQAARLDNVSASTSMGRLLGALACLAVSGIVLAWMIWRVAGVLTVRWITLANLSDAGFAELMATGDQGPAGAALDEAGQIAPELYGSAAPSIARLNEAVRTTGERVADALQQTAAPSTDPSLETLILASEHARTAASRVVDLANYRSVVDRFRGIRHVIIGGVLVLLACNVIFVLLTKPTPATSPGSIVIISTHRDHVVDAPMTTTTVPTVGGTTTTVPTVGGTTTTTTAGNTATTVQGFDCPQPPCRAG